MRDLLTQFPDRPILVVGDLMLDEFIWGQVSRISPEAPVPVVEVRRRTQAVGGAANAAANAAALGGRVAVAGVVGDDAEGRRVAELLRGQGIDTAGLVVDAARPTTTKTRVVAHSQQMVRIDHEQPGPIPDAVAETLLAAVRDALSRVRACVVSDYGKGVLTPAVVGQLMADARRAGVPVIVDPKGTDYAKYTGATVVKPNQMEAGKVLNRDLRTDAEVDRAGVDLRAILGADSAVLITRGPQGMSLFESDKEPVHVPTQAREVYDVTGAGDTVAGAMAMTLAAGGSLENACRLASLAAAVVVAKLGTATCDLAELRAAVG